MKTFDIQLNVFDEDNNFEEVTVQVYAGRLSHALQEAMAMFAPSPVIICTDHEEIEDGSE